MTWLWLHIRRAKHQKTMAQAQTWIGLAEFLAREAHRLDDSELDTSWWYIKETIKITRKCGCPSRIWPTNVQRCLPRKP